MTKYLKLLLWPFSLLYGGIMTVRNYCYDKGIKPAYQFKLPVIAVGNLTVGGTGKTPHVEYLLRLLHNYKVATLSRGYKRKSKGFVLAGPDSTADELGDEPFQYHIDFPDVSVAVSEKRVPGIKQLLDRLPQTQVVVLDDAMQHRAVKPSLNIMLTDYHRLFYKDYVVPAGLLREPKAGATRADVVVVSKCPISMAKEEMASIRKRINQYTKSGTEIFFSTIKYGHPVAVGLNQEVTKEVVLLAGIANPKPLKKYLEEQQYRVIQELIFPDHHQYTRQDMLKLIDFVEAHKGKSISIITTSKDAVKLTGATFTEITKRLPLFYLPIEVAFMDGGDTFDQLVLEHVNSMIPQKAS